MGKPQMWMGTIADSCLRGQAGKLLAQRCEIFWNIMFGYWVFTIGASLVCLCLCLVRLCLCLCLVCHWYVCSFWIFVTGYFTIWKQCHSILRSQHHVHWVRRVRHIATYTTHTTYATYTTYTGYTRYTFMDWNLSNGILLNGVPMGRLGNI